MYTSIPGRRWTTKDEDAIFLYPSPFQRVSRAATAPRLDRRSIGVTKFTKHSKLENRNRHVASYYTDASFTASYNLPILSASTTWLITCYDDEVGFATTSAAAPRSRRRLGFASVVVLLPTRYGNLADDPATTASSHYNGRHWHGRLLPRDTRGALYRIGAKVWDFYSFRSSHCASLFSSLQGNVPRLSLFRRTRAHCQRLVAQVCAQILSAGRCSHVGGAIGDCLSKNLQSLWKSDGLRKV